MLKLVVLVVVAVALGGSNAHGAPKIKLETRQEIRDYLKQWIDPVIYGGEDAKPGEFPHMAALLSNGYQICGGSVVSSRHVLTAAHCVVNGSPSSLSIVAGEHRLNDDDGTEQPRNVAEIFIHPSYGSAGYDYDIAVLELTDDLEFNDNVQPIQPWDQDETPFVPAFVSGWGEAQDGSYPNTLKKLNLTIYDDEVCSKAYGDSYTENMLCATGDIENGGQCVCFGDSGSPMYIIVDGVKRQVGIVSWGNPCANAGYPAAYAEVGRLSQFVKKVAHL